MQRRLSASLLTILVALIVGPGAARAASAPACKLEKLAQLPLKFEHREPLVQVSINGKPGWFAVDTGASNSSIMGGAAREYGLREITVDHSTFYGIGGGQDAKSVMIDEFGLGDKKVRNLRMLSLGHAGSSALAGVLGRDFIDQVGDLEFDLAGAAVRFWKPVDCGAGSLAYWSKTALVVDLRHDEPEAPYFVTLKINGRLIEAMLDSGASPTVLTPNAARSVGVRKEDYDPEVHYLGGIGEEKIAARLAHLTSIDIGGEEVKPARLLVADLFARNTEILTGSILPSHVELRDEPKMLLGTDFLVAHRILIATSQHRLYFTASSGAELETFGNSIEFEDAPANSTPPIR